MLAREYWNTSSGTEIDISAALKTILTTERHHTESDIKALEHIALRIAG